MLKIVADTFADTGRKENTHTDTHTRISALKMLAVITDTYTGIEIKKDTGSNTDTDTDTDQTQIQT